MQGQGLVGKRLFLPSLGVQSLGFSWSAKSTGNWLNLDFRGEVQAGARDTGVVRGKSKPRACRTPKGGRVMEEQVLGRLLGSWGSRGWALFGGREEECEVLEAR